MAAALLTIIAAPVLPHGLAAEPDSRAVAQRYQEAEALWQRIVATTPANPEAYYNLGIALGHQQKWNAAIAAYGQAIALEPTFAHAHYNLGRALVQIEQFSAAAQAYRQAQQLDPQESLAQELLQELEAIAREKGLPIAIADSVTQQK